MAFDGNEEHEISLDDAVEFTFNYRNQMTTGQILGSFFGKEAIETLLSQDGCVGIRIYYGLDENDKQVLVLVGADEDENDLIEKGNVLMEMGIGCPDRCGDSNVLNS